MKRIFTALAAVAVTAALAVTGPTAASVAIAPGQSWQAAYDGASAGSTVTVQAGNHGSPTLVGSKVVTFLGDNGAVVAKMPGTASNITYQNIDIDTGATRGGYSASNITAPNITWKQVDVRGNVGQVYINGGGTFFKWLGGSFAGGTTRNCPDSEPVWVDGDNATIDGVVFGAFHAGECNGDNFHLEDIRVQGADDFSILNSSFANQSDAGSGHIFITTTSPNDSQARRMRIEGNTFAPVIGTYAIQAHTNVTSYDHYIIRNNRFDQPLLMDSPFNSLIACGNTGSVPTAWKTSCGGIPPPPPPPPPPGTDTTPPSTPTNQVISDITQTSLKMSWGSSTDNVGVTGYKLWKDGVLVTTVTGLNYTYTELECNKSYLVGLTARDAAGNESNVAYAQGTVTTAACITPPPPPPPAIDIPGAIKLLQDSLDIYFVGQLHYTVAQAKRTRVYQALIKIGGTWR